MKTIKLTYPHDMVASDLPQAVCALGFFDGIHKGHQKVIETAVKEAKKRHIESAVITFHPHPSVVLNKQEKNVKYITPLQEKQRILAQHHVDRLYIIEFNHALSRLSPEDFVRTFISGLNIEHVVAGFDFTYGYQGKGNMNHIVSHGAGDLTATTVPKLEADDEKVSSTRIRQLLGLGDVAKASELLGRALSVVGTVVSGDKRGREIGYPTANLSISDDVLLPISGVYAVTIQYNEQTYYGMANLGVKPTFESGVSKETLEVFIFDFQGNLYDQTLRIAFHKFIRKEQKFAGITELVEQLTADEQEIRRFFSEDMK